MYCHISFLEVLKSASLAFLIVTHAIFAQSAETTSTPNTTDWELVRDDLVNIATKKVYEPKKASCGSGKLQTVFAHNPKLTEEFMGATYNGRDPIVVDGFGEKTTLANMPPSLYTWLSELQERGGTLTVFKKRPDEATGSDSISLVVAEVIKNSVNWLLKQLNALANVAAREYIFGAVSGYNGQVTVNSNDVIHEIRLTCRSR